MSSSERGVLSLFLAAACSLSACTAERLGTLAGQGSAAGASVVLTAASPKHGTASITLPSGEECAGRFNTVPAGLTWDDDRVHWVDHEDSLLGILVVSCPSGNVLRCEFEQEKTEPNHGSCRDRVGSRYALVR